MKKIVVDIAVIAASILVAVWIVRTGAVDMALAWTGDGILFASFVAGIFFTSVLTTAPAIVVLGELSLEGNLVLIALIGGLGAMVGDFVLFWFVRDRITKDAAPLLKGKRFRGVMRLFKKWHMRRVLPILGALVIASPFPDEIGLTLMGVSKLSTSRFLLISFSMNTIGIFLIGLVARSLV